MKNMTIKWLLGALIVLSFAGIAGYFNKADAQETGDIIIIGDDIYTVIEIGDDTTVLMGDGE